MVNTPSLPVGVPLGDDDRRLRAFRRFVLWHSKMELAAALHHTSGRRTSTTPHFSSTAVEPIAPRVVDPLPPIEEFTVPVYDKVLQEHFAASEMPENIVEFPVVPEQVIVQAIPEFVGPLPPIEEFTGPVYNHVHHERCAAGVTTENLVDIPVVQEQVIVQAIPQVVGSLPPVEEFTGPGFHQVHHEHIDAVPAVTEFFPLSDDEGDELSAGLRPAPLCEHLPQEQVLTELSRPLCPFRSSMLLCRRWGRNRWSNSFRSSTRLWVPSLLSKCPSCR